VQDYDKLCNAAAADVRKAVMADVTRGGLADWTRILPDAIMFNNDAGRGRRRRRPVPRALLDHSRRPVHPISLITLKQLKPSPNRPHEPVFLLLFPPNEKDQTMAVLLTMRKRVCAAKVEAVAGTAETLAAGDGAENFFNPQFEADIPAFERQGQLTLSALCQRAGEPVGESERPDAPVQRPLRQYAILGDRCWRWRRASPLATGC
jgi:hypothetical protein